MTNFNNKEKRWFLQFWWIAYIFLFLTMVTLAFIKTDGFNWIAILLIVVKFTFVFLSIRYAVKWYNQLKKNGDL